MPSAQALSPHGAVRKSHIRQCSQRLSHTTAMPSWSQIWGEPGSAPSIPSQAEGRLLFFPRGVTEHSLQAEWLCEAVVECPTLRTPLRREGQGVCCSLQSLREVQLPEEHSRGRGAMPSLVCRELGSRWHCHQLASEEGARKDTMR